MTNKKPLLSQLNIIPRDFDTTLAFYRKLGVDFPDDANLPDSARHATATLSNGLIFDVDNQPLARMYNAGWRRPDGSSRVLIGFSLPSREAVDKKYAELIAAGHKGCQPPYDAFWGVRYAIVSDPDGNDVGIMSPVDEKRRKWPPIESPAP
jgi:uncharacterized glyoxalase superfamily protein PhnB